MQKRVCTSPAQVVAALMSAAVVLTATAVRAQTPAPSPAVTAPTRIPVSLSSLPSALVHLDTPDMLRRGKFAGQLGVRSFSGDEKATYVSFGVQTGVADGWDGILRATTAQKKSFALGGNADIQHGGSDFELVAKYRFPDPPNGPARIAAAVLLGIAFPSTPAQTEIVPTLGLTASTAVTNRVTGYVNPRLVLLDGNPLYGIGIGAQARLSDSLTLVGDVTPLIRGDNTRRTSDGARTDKTVYGIALRLTPRAGGEGSVFALDLGYANGTGITTGFAMTPGLGGSGSFYAALTFRR